MGTSVFQVSCGQIGAKRVSKPVNSLRTEPLSTKICEDVVSVNSFQMQMQEVHFTTDNYVLAQHIALKL